jgi:hypothetical protein
MGVLKPALLFAAVLLGFTVLRLVREHQKSYGCEMTYMYPTYEPVSDPQLEHAAYRLYLYREQTVHTAGELGPRVRAPSRACWRLQAKAKSIVGHRVHRNMSTRSRLSHGTSSPCPAATCRRRFIRLACALHPGQRWQP